MHHLLTRWSIKTWAVIVSVGTTNAAEVQEEGARIPAKPRCGEGWLRACDIISGVTLDYASICASMYIYIYTYIPRYMRACMHTYIYICVHTRTYVFVYTHTHAYPHVCMSICIYMYNIRTCFMSGYANISIICLSFVCVWVLRMQRHVVSPCTNNKANAGPGAYKCRFDVYSPRREA